ncbi:MAG: hypothetical protein GEV08_20690 [Acidimicrobiia bacterium]|nr:hypothetical protein [Acidimicrobiia bacterium]
MDLVGFLNDLTGGELLLWKVVLSTVVFALAGLQVAMAARFWGVTGFPGLNPDVAASVHRWSGRATIVLAMLVALACLAGPAGATSPTRVVLHTVFGSLVFAALVAKFLVLKVVPSAARLLPAAGIGLFLSFAAVWATSVADYVSVR